MKHKIIKERAVAMYKNGATYEEIADAMGATRSTVASWFYRNRAIVPCRSRKWSTRDISVARSMFLAGSKNKDVARVLSIQRGETITAYEVNILVMCAANNEKLTPAQWREKYMKK